MDRFSWLPKLRLYSSLAALSVVALIILACGEAEAPAPRPTATPVDIAGITAGLQKAIQAEVGKIQPPLGEAEIRGLIEAAVTKGIPESVSAREIQSMV